MSEPRAYDMSTYQRIIGYEGERIEGDFKVLQASGDKETWVTAIDVTIWDEGHHAGRVLHSADLTGSVRDGVATLSPHMVASNKRDDVLDVWDEMLAALVMVAAAFPADTEGKAQ